MQPSDKHSWSHRDKFVVPFLQTNSSVIDYGCGHKDILNYYTPKNYIGLDLNPDADVIVDLNKYIPKYSGYDYALVLGVLEYLDKPFEFLNLVKNTAKTFIILNFLREQKKPEWQQTFTLEQVMQEYNNIFDSVLNYKVINKYDIFLCRGIK
jgi:hypothetical protein